MNLILATVDRHELTRNIVHIIVYGLIAYLLWWLIDYCKIPEPFNRVAKVLVAVVFVLFLIEFLLDLDW